MNIYRLRSKSRNEWWVIAATEQDAINYSLSKGRVKKAENVIGWEDQTERLTLFRSYNLPEILATQTTPTFLALEIANCPTLGDIVTAFKSDGPIPPEPDHKWVTF